MKSIDMLNFTKFLFEKRITGCFLSGIKKQKIKSYLTYSNKSFIVIVWVNAPLYSL